MNNLFDLTKLALNLYVGERDKAIQKISKKFTWIEAFLAILIINLIGALVSIIVNINVNSILFLPIQIFSAIFFGIIALLFSSFVGYGLIFLCMKLFGGKAGFLETVKFGLSLAILPSIAFFIFNFIPESATNSLVAGDFSPLSIMLSIIIGIFSLAVLIWNLVVSIFTFSELHKISKLRAFFALILPIVIITIIIILIVLLFMLIYSFVN